MSPRPHPVDPRDPDEPGRGDEPAPSPPPQIDLLRQRNAQLNDVLTAGAEAHGFAVASPALTPLCERSGDSMGPDLQGLRDRHPFHPTATGSLRIAAGLAQALARVDPRRVPDEPR